MSWVFRIDGLNLYPRKNIGNASLFIGIQWKPMDSIVPHHKTLYISGGFRWHFLGSKPLRFPMTGIIPGSDTCEAKRKEHRVSWANSASHRWTGRLVRSEFSEGCGFFCSPMTDHHGKGPGLFTYMYHTFFGTCRYIYTHGSYGTCAQTTMFSPVGFLLHF